MSIKISCFTVALTLLAFLQPGPVRADDAAWAAFSEPGTVALLRHALAPGTGDPAEFALGDCSTQRNLDATGREQARHIGDAVRARSIDVDRVLTSEWCRCVETADLLGLAEVEPYPALNSFFQDRSTRDAQTAELRAFLANLPADEKAILVTHQVNITALTGVYPASGELVIVEISAEGEVTLRGRIETLD